MGTYYLIEEKSPRGYERSEEVLELVCGGDDTGNAVVVYRQSIKNQKQDITITIQKSDKETHESIASPAVFEIYAVEMEEYLDEATGDIISRPKTRPATEMDPLTGEEKENQQICRTFVERLTTDGTGRAVSGKLPVNTWYQVEEIEAPEGYIRSDYFSDLFYADGDKTGEAVVNYNRVIENTPIRGDITLTKYDAKYPKNKLSGAEFTVYEDTNRNGSYDAGIDQEAGMLIEEAEGFYAMRRAAYGQYFVRETKAPAGFLTDKNVYSLFIDTNEKVYEIENKAGIGFFNDAMTGSLLIIKTSEDHKIEGISFRVTGMDITGHNYDQTFTTDKNGKIRIDELRIGNYTVSEVENEASVHYVLPQAQEVMIAYNEVAEAEFENKRKGIPRTGDTGIIGIWLIGAGCSLLAICRYFSIGEKEKYHNNK